MQIIVHPAFLFWHATPFSIFSTFWTVNYQNIELFKGMRMGFSFLSYSVILKDFCDILNIKLFSYTPDFVSHVAGSTSESIWKPFTC